VVVQLVKGWAKWVGFCAVAFGMFCSLPRLERLWHETTLLSMTILTFKGQNLCKQDLVIRISVRKTSWLMMFTRTMPDSTEKLRRKFWLENLKGRGIGVDSRIILKWTLKEQLWGCGRISGSDPMAGSRKHGRYLSGSIEGENFLIIRATISFSKRTLLSGVTLRNGWNSL